PLPVFFHLGKATILSNGAIVVNSLGISNTNIEKICVSGSNSTEFYLVRALLNPKAIPVTTSSQDCSKVTTESYEIPLSNVWKSKCNDLPIVLKVILLGTVPEDVIPKVKAIIRESASIQENLHLVSPGSKELGLKGRKAIECFFKISKENLSTPEVTYRIM
ncbi:hypothetical protein, partial [Acidianus sp. RZ1]